MSSGGRHVAIIGGGPAGLTAGYELQRLDPAVEVSVYEADRIVGGIARTETYKGFRFDIGGHRFFTKVPEVDAMWREVMADDFVRVPRLSRIYYRGKFYEYPLKLLNALGNIGPYEASRIVLSYLKWRVRPNKTEESFEEWVINRFGGRLYMHFFRSYTRRYGAYLRGSSRPTGRRSGSRTCPSARRSGMPSRARTTRPA